MEELPKPEENKNEKAPTQEEMARLKDWLENHPEVNPKSVRSTPEGETSGIKDYEDFYTKSYEVFDENQIEDWFRNNAEPINPEKNKDYKIEIVRLEKLLLEFEGKHSIEELSSIKEISPELNKFFSMSQDKDVSVKDREDYKSKLSLEDKELFLIRSEAKKDLVEITAILSTLWNYTKIPENEYKRLMVLYKILSRAVGMLNKNGIRHDN